MQVKIFTCTLSLCWLDIWKQWHPNSSLNILFTHLRAGLAPAWTGSENAIAPNPFFGLLCAIPRIELWVKFSTLRSLERRSYQPTRTLFTFFEKVNIKTITISIGCRLEAIKRVEPDQLIRAMVSWTIMTLLESRNEWTSPWSRWWWSCILRIADVLHISSKRCGEYDDGAFQNQCFKIPPKRVLPGVQRFFDSEEWKKYNRPELELYMAVNRSLDLTIKELGPDFNTKLALFCRAQLLVEERCASNVTMPCPRAGERIPSNETNCLSGDSGCAFDCLDRISTELDLWDTK